MRGQATGCVVKGGVRDSELQGLFGNSRSYPKSTVYSGRRDSRYQRK